MRVLLLAFAFAACGAPPTAMEPVPETVVDEEQEPIESVEIPRSRTGTISRAELTATVDKGLGSFLAHIAVQPFQVDNIFRGWSIVSFDSEWVDLVPGDVVVAVNGRGLRTPDDAQRVWETLAASDEIVVSAVRAGEPFELRFLVSSQAEHQ